MKNYIILFLHSVFIIISVAQSLVYIPFLLMLIANLIANMIIPGIGRLEQHISGVSDIPILIVITMLACLYLAFKKNGRLEKNQVYLYVVITFLHYLGTIFFFDKRNCDLWKYYVEYIKYNS